ncbi:EAL domain-containing protein [Nitrincola sp.]|uniref:EAL domain-containing protein n=1 Tax=Nitrincola sp. TaxID=1926584 RepID=UPI003A947804
MIMLNIRNFILIIAIFFSLIVLAHVFAIKNQYEKQNEFSDKLLEHAELVSTQLQNAIDEAKEIEIENCDEYSLGVIRQITHKYLYVYDLGLIENEVVKCTANWGVLSPPIWLPKDHHVDGRFLLYSMVGGLFPIEIDLDITRSDNIAAFTAYFAFQPFLSRNDDFSFSIEATSDNHVFVNYDSPAQNIKWMNFSIIDSVRVNTSVCSSLYGYCVHTFNKRPGLLYYKVSLVLTILLIGFVFSCVIFYAVNSYFYNKGSIEYRLRKAILNKTLYMEYQPIISLKTSEIIGVESLVRWDDEVYGRVSPELFISIAEKIKLYQYVAYQTATSSIDDMVSVLKTRKDFFLSINVSTFEVTEESFLVYLNKKVLDNGINPNQIKIEITEEIEVPLNVLSDFSNRAKRCGFRVSLDDFGTGVSNLVWLTEINFDDIKIDRIFTQSLNDDLKKDMVLSIINLISGLNKQLIFEGVENTVELEFIKNYCDDAYVQGWYFFKSVPRHELIEILNDDYSNSTAYIS